MKDQMTTVWLGSFLEKDSFFDEARTALSERVIETFDVIGMT